MRTQHALALVIALVGCTTTTIDKSWRAPAAPELSSVVTVALAPDDHTRRVLEDQMAAQLSRHGVHAVPAYAALGNEDFSDHDHAVAAARAKGFDGLVAVRFIAVRDEEDFNGTPRKVARLQVTAYSLATNRLVWTAVSTSNRPFEVVGNITRVAGDRLVHEHVVGASQQAMR